MNELKNERIMKQYIQPTIESMVLGATPIMDTLHGSSQEGSQSQNYAPRRGEIID